MRHVWTLYFVDLTKTCSTLYIGYFGHFDWYEQACSVFQTFLFYFILSFLLSQTHVFLILSKLNSYCKSNSESMIMLVRQGLLAFIDPFMQLNQVLIKTRPINNSRLAGQNNFFLLDTCFEHLIDFFFFKRIIH